MSSEIEGAWDRSTETGNAGPLVRRVDARGSATIVLLAAISTVTSLVNGFAYNDRLLILNNPRVHRLAHIGRVWTQTYWPPWMGAGLYRPLTMSAFVTEWWIGHGAPWVFHATNVALYIVVCLLVYRLAKLQLPPAGAWVAAALFAVHPVHVEAVGNVVGQSELWAACGILAAVIAFVRWRRSAVARASWCTRPTLDGVGDTAPRLLRLATPLGKGLGAENLGGLRHQLVLVALVIGACLAKEHAVVTPALLVLAEVFLVDDPRPWRDRWRALRPFVLLLSLAVVSYVVVRAHVIGSWAGDRPNVVLEHLSAAARRWTMLGVVSEWTRLLMWPWRLVVEYAPRDITIHEHFEPSLIPNAVLLALILTLVVIAVRRRALAGFALLWIVVTLLLVSNLIVPTGILLAERTLFLPSVGAALLIGDAVTRLTARFGTSSGFQQRDARTLAPSRSRGRHRHVAGGVGLAQRPAAARVAKQCDCLCPSAARCPAQLSGTQCLRRFAVRSGRQDRRGARGSNRPRAVSARPGPVSRSRARVHACGDVHAGNPVAPEIHRRTGVRRDGRASPVGGVSPGGTRPRLRARRGAAGCGPGAIRVLRGRLPQGADRHR